LIDFLNQPGFLSTHAPLGADLSLVLILISAALMTLGVFLIRRKHREAHRWVQTAAVILNTTVVLTAMRRSFILNVIP
jgi:uncharacterized membrane protein YozB (DUF420 family)